MKNRNLRILLGMLTALCPIASNATIVTGHYKGKLTQSNVSKALKVQVFIHASPVAGENDSGYGLIFYNDVNQSPRAGVFRIEELPDGTQAWIRLYQDKGNYLRTNASQTPALRATLTQEESKLRLRIAPAEGSELCQSEFTKIVAEPGTDAGWIEFPTRGFYLPEGYNESKGTLSSEKFQGTLVFKDSSHEGSFALSKLAGGLALLRAQVMDPQSISGWSLSRSLVGVIIPVEQKVRYLRGTFARVLKTVTPSQVVQIGVPSITPHSSMLGTFVTIPAGTFVMGSPDYPSGPDDQRSYDEWQHKVTLTRAFEMQATVVTQKQWYAVMGNNPSKFKTQADCPTDYISSVGCPNHPVESVSWNDAKDFIKRLNDLLHDGYTYRLPTEAEWEYAARAGTTTAYSFGDSTELISDYAWYKDNSAERTHAVGLKMPNPWGLYDMHGNVLQWVMDGYEEDYRKLPGTDPVAENESKRVVRGGGYLSRAFDLRSAYRIGVSPSSIWTSVGFRLVRTR